MPPLRLLLALATFHFSLFTSPAADFPTPTNNQEITNVPFTAPQDAVKLMHLPPGFKATLFAAEPDVQNPIALCWDEKGRLWIAENYTYSDAKERFDLKLKDRILIFEDTDNDGHFDKRTVFADDLQMLTSIERGFGGVYALCPPHLLWIPTKDDKPSGPPQILLDGFSTTAASRHTFANGLKWGPDGWLYGRIGISSTSWIGVPGDSSKGVSPLSRNEQGRDALATGSRQPTAGGIWRYHPTRKIYEPYCHGTTNPWGMDWDEHGEMFFINTVIGHLWHGIHGAHFKRMHGEDPYPRIYGLIDQHADHYHWDTGEAWSDVRKIGVTESSSGKGGGHAHVGMMIYQGTNWPKKYRGKVFTLNLHGHRINVDRLEREGSGYVGKHEPDFMKTDDPWFRGIELSYGPDGGVYILDWSDIGECHEADGVHRTSGRIYKITHGDARKPKESDLTKLGDEELVKLQLSDNEWLVRMARWELRERAAVNNLNFSTVRNAAIKLSTNSDLSRDVASKLRLRWLWLDASFDGLASSDARLSDDPFRIGLQLPNLTVTEYSTAWESRLSILNITTDELARALDGLTHPGEINTTPFARLTLSTQLARLPLNAKSKLAGDLLSHAEDATDHNLPLMYWFGIRDLPPAELVKLFAGCQIPLVRQFIARRVTEEIDKDPAPLNALLASRTSLKLVEPSNEFQTRSTDILRGMTDALKGWRKAKKPEAWEKFASAVNRSKGVSPLPTDQGRDALATPEVMLRDLNILFGDGRALDEVRAIALDDKADVEARRSALNTLIEARSPDARKLCEKFLTERGLGLAAVQGLATFDDPAIAETILKRWRNFYPNEHGAVAAALASRPSFAKVLLAHLERSKGVSPLPADQGRDALATILPGDITPVIARQIRSFNDPALTKQLAETWGEIRESSEDKKKLIAALKARLTPEFIAKGDPSQGRFLYAGICAACHKLYGEGTTIGPDLTGSGRHEINYLIENIADPSAVVAVDYTMAVVTLKDGRVLNGIISARTDRTITVKMVGLETTVDRNDIVKQEQLPVSIMPEGQLTALNDRQLSDLFAYLMSNAQVPLPAAK